MTAPEVLAIAPLFIVRNVPASLAFYRDRFGFDVEFLYVANLHGLRLKEIPVRWDNDERSKVNVFRDSLRMFNEVREIRRNAKKGLYSN